MQRGVVIAWAVGEGIIVYRAIKLQRPPLPSELLASSALFVALAIVGEAAPALATALAAGVDIAAYLQLFPTAATNTASASAVGQAAGAGAALGAAAA